MDKDEVAGAVVEEVFSRLLRQEVSILLPDLACAGTRGCVQLALGQCPVLNKASWLAVVARTIEAVKVN